MASAKAETIVDHFTQDPALKAQIVGLIDEVMANPGMHNLDSAIAKFTNDPVLAAEIKANLQHIRQGGEPSGISAKYTNDATRATNVAQQANAHRAAVEQILAS